VKLSSCVVSCLDSGDSEVEPTWRMRRGYTGSQIPTTQVFHVRFLQRSGTRKYYQPLP
jgi:hypothetical protein